MSFLNQLVWIQLAQLRADGINNAPLPIRKPFTPTAQLARVNEKLAPVLSEEIW